MELATVGPASPGARAQLLLALLVCATFPTLYVLTPQSHTHGVTFDSIYGLDADGRLAQVDLPVWMEPAPLHRDRSARDDRVRLPVGGGPAHTVAIDPAGTLLFDGCAVDAVSLRMRIDLVRAAGEGWLDLRPDPEAPWERVDLVLAMFARAHVERFRFDNRPFAGAVDEPAKTRPAAESGAPGAPRNCPDEPPLFD